MSYISNALRTESNDFSKINERLSKEDATRLLHAGLGMVTESAEFADVLKKHIFYGREIDKVNLAEEVGDLFWYCAIAADVLGVSFDEMQLKNINKLAARFPDKFKEKDANVRDLKTERKILEQ